MKAVHVHIPLQRPLQLHRTRDADEGEGKWVTINGAHVHIGKAGKIDKGPAELTGKTELGAHAHHHETKAQAHGEALQAKGKQHPDYNAHVQAHNAHVEAARHFKSAEYNASAGNLKAAVAEHASGQKKAEEAEKHGAAASKKEGADLNTFQKPKAHVGLHANAAEDVKGSEPHEAEHKRLMDRYDKSKQSWERNAINTLVTNNAAAGAQSKAQALHHKALSLSERAKSTQEPAHHKEALAAVEEADKARASAGGVGHAEKAKQLHAMRKEHTAAVDKHEKAAAKESAAGMKHDGTGKGHPTPEAAQADVKARRADLESKGFKHDKSEGSADDVQGERHHFAHENGSRAVVTHKKDAVSGRHSVGSLVNEMNKSKKPAAKSAPRKSSGGKSATSALGKMAARAAKKAAEDAADQDPKHHK